MVNLLLRMEDTDIEDRDGTDNTTALMEASGLLHLLILTSSFRQWTP